MFGLTEEQEQLRKEVRAFAEREVGPHVAEWDEKSEFPHAVVKKLGEMGLLGVIFPETLGGAGDAVDRWTIVGKKGTRIAIVEEQRSRSTANLDIHEHVEEAVCRPGRRKRRHIQRAWSVIHLLLDFAPSRARRIKGDMDRAH